MAKPLAKDNVESMRGVMQLHRDAVEEIQSSDEFGYLKDAARECWDAALARGDENGYAMRKYPCWHPPAQSRF